MTCFVSHLESAIDGTCFQPGRPHTTHKDRPIWVRYDLEAVTRAVTRAQMASRGPSLWRWRELLPVEKLESIVTLGEGLTPLLRCPRLGQEIGLNDLWIKDDSQLPLWN